MSCGETTMLNAEPLPRPPAGEISIVAARVALVKVSSEEGGDKQSCRPPCRSLDHAAPSTRIRRDFEAALRMASAGAYSGES